MSQKLFVFEGKIVTVARDGRSAVVQLKNHDSKLKYAVIDRSTKRSEHLVGSDGVLVEGAIVKGRGHEASEAIIADEVELTTAR
ncbi:MAG: hypothetical protein EOP24_34335 [Hyphomicrobiales bacterium]|nr:MAG: hypothetical protein EOP24_34335 [Hyphomicrobiales bacterium]